MARILSLAGAALPIHLMDPGFDNPTGFWESLAIAHFNDEVLHAFDSRWDDTFGPRRRRNKPLPISAFVPRARELLNAEFGDADLIVLKEPRVTLLLELWQEVFALEGISDYYVILVRRPDEVYRSLNERSPIDRHKALLLWSSYMLNAELRTRDKSRLFVSFESLLRDADGILDKIEETFQVDLPRRTWAADAETQRFLKGELKHHNLSGMMKLPAALRPVTDLYNFFSAAADGAPKNDDVPGDVAAWLKGLEDVVGPLVAAVEYDASKSRTDMQAQVAELEANLRNQLAQTAAEMHGSALRATELEAALASAGAVALELERDLRGQLEAKGQSSAQRVAELESDLAAARSQATAMEQALNARMTQIQIAAEAAASQLAEIERSLGDQLSLASADRSAALEQVIRLQEALDASLSKAAADAEMSFTQLEAARAEGAASQDQARRLLEHLEAGRAEQEAQAQALLDRLAEVEAEANVYRTRAAELEQAVEQKVAAAHSEAAAAMEEARRLLEHFDASEDQARVLRDRVASADEDLRMARDQTARLEQSLAATQAQASALEAALEAIGGSWSWRVAQWLSRRRPRSPRRP